MITWLKWAADYAIWDLLSTIILFVSLVLGFFLIFWSKKRVRNLNFFTKRLDRDNSNYPLKVHIEIRNYTGRNVVISSPYYKYGDLKPDPNARGDSPSEEYEMKFPNNGELKEVVYLIRNGENVATWIPIDPQHTDQEVDEAIKNRRVAILYCKCTWLEENPRVHKLNRKI